jgi:hypothetical protein
MITFDLQRKRDEGLLLGKADEGDSRGLGEGNQRAKYDGVKLAAFLGTRKRSRQGSNSG